MKLFAVIQHGVIKFSSNQFTPAHAYYNLCGPGSKLERLKMTGRLYKRAYRFLKLRSQGDQFKCFGPLDSLNDADRLTVIEFLKQQHQVKFI